MSWMEFTAAMVSTLAWPAAILTVVIVLKRTKIDD